MKKPAIIVGIVIILAVIIGGGVFIFSNSKKQPASSTPPVLTNSVTIQNFAFTPADISIKAGAKVTWTNRDNVIHTIVASDGQSNLNSGDINPGSNYVFQFDKPGTYHYRCGVHPDMTGTITVTN